ncbi:MAG: transglutaminase-like domain-containing protein [Propionibacteriaceae bacterium]|nr:transglutaminase-like domain-containing protein [Propionibacteriaceae bacterium]
MSGDDWLQSSPWAHPSRPQAGGRLPAERPAMVYSPVDTQWAAPDSSPEMPTPPPGRTGKKRGKKALRGFLITALVIALVAAGFVFIPRLSWESSDYGYDIVERTTVEPDSIWTLTAPLIGVEQDTTNSRNPWHTIIEVYSDPELAYPISFRQLTQEPIPVIKRLAITPSQADLNPWFTFPDYREEPTLGTEGMWPEGTYYVVQRNSLLGYELKKPRVHIYTVEPHAGSLPHVDYTMEASDAGVPVFEWTEVAGASAYYIIRKAPTTTQGNDDTRTDIIGWVEGSTTKWYASSQDLDYHNERQNGEKTSQYNSAFVAFDPERGVPCQPQDAVYDQDSPPEYNTTNYTYPSFSVVAVDNRGNTSFATFADGQKVVADTPVATASRTLEWMREQSGQGANYLPETFPVTMGDCRTTFVPSQTLTFVSHPDNYEAEITYGGEGTLLTETVSTEAGATYSAVTSLGEKSGVPRQYQKHFSQDLVMMTPREVKDYSTGREVSTSAPESPFTWWGTSEMVTYIAANMFAGQEAIDMTAFLTPDAPLIIDATNEAFLQNPYITDMFPVVGVLNNILYVDYEMTAQERSQAAARIKAKVETVAASIISPGMNDRAKALAINEYLAKNAVYDDGAYKFSQKSHTREEFVEAFPNSWDAEGVLLDGKGVCTSYAAAFQLLAREVGLETMIITGYADDSGVGHAWIKAKFGSQWRVIDPTWNSNIWEQVRGNVNRYFGLTDREANRTEFDAFVVDRYLNNYKAH